MRRWSCLFVLSITLMACGSPVQEPLRISSSEINSSEYSDDQLIHNAYQTRESDLWVQASGKVVKLLTDDLKGSRHQRFIVRLDHGQTLLISHNIDLAPRLDNLSTGDIVRFRGEYEWNEKGGVVHWTHHDPSFRRTGGWIIHQQYQYK